MKIMFDNFIELVIINEKSQNTKIIGNKLLKTLFSMKDVMLVSQTLLVMKNSFYSNIYEGTYNKLVYTVH